MKSWSYSQITKHAEEEIKHAMKNRSEAEPGMRRMWWAQAHGIYTLWYRVTVGWQKDGDSERLEALTETD